MKKRRKVPLSKSVRQKQKQRKEPKNLFLIQSMLCTIILLGFLLLNILDNDIYANIKDNLQVTLNNHNLPIFLNDTSISSPIYNPEEVQFVSPNEDFAIDQNILVNINYASEYPTNQKKQ